MPERDRALPFPPMEAGIRLRAAETLAAAFEAQAARNPAADALTFAGTSISYAELNRRAELLADRLFAAGIGPGAVVGLCLPRSADLVIGLLAILKAGAAYLPLDPAYPGDRIAFMAEDAGASVIVCGRETAPVLPGHARLVLIGREHDGFERRVPSGPPRPRPSPADLAYVIYTSGSTGRPKGVAVEQRAVLRLFSQTAHWFAFGPQDVWALFHSVSFDVSVWEIWAALLHGGRLVVVPDRTTRDPDELLRLLVTEGVTGLCQTPSSFAALDRADAARGGRDPLSLRRIVLAGESLDPRRLRGWYSRRGESVRLINMYGPTEATVYVSYRPMTPGDAGRGGSPIGVPLPDTEFLLLDGETLSPVPDGAVGELFVGGAGLARGYLDRPELTAARFVPHPWRSGERLYRSGDLARREPDGGYDFLGRADQQVKIRGFRVELGEIEAALLTHGAVADAAVLLREDEPDRRGLVGYVVSSEAGPATPTALRAHLARTLPDYMIPALFVFLPGLPLTVNGKLDRNALPRPSRERPALASAYVPPRSAREREIAATFAIILHIDEIGIDDSVFELGGNSLLIAEAHRQLDRDGTSGLTLVDLYAYPTVRALAARLERGGGSREQALSAARDRASRARAALASRPRAGADQAATA